MRVVDGGQNQCFSRWLSLLSYSANLRGVIGLPEFILTTQNRDEFRKFVYSDELLQSGVTQPFRERAILSARNHMVEEINNEVIALRRVESREYFALDQVIRDGQEPNTDHPQEYLQALSAPGLPQGRILLQIGMPVMLLRNLNPKEGLCNGTRLIVTHLFPQGIRGKIMSTVPEFDGEEHYIHRIDMTTNHDLPFTLIRRQLPLRPCFAMTINKSQGQTLKRVGVDLSTPVFSHGQFYVALSRVFDVSSIILLLPPGRRETTNIVYPEVLMRPEDAIR